MTSNSIAKYTTYSQTSLIILNQSQHRVYIHSIFLEDNLFCYNKYFQPLKYFLFDKIPFLCLPTNYILEAFCTQNK